MTMGADEGRPLRANRAFVALWLATISSGLGFQMLAVAVGWQVYAITGRAFDLGLIGFVQFLPSVLLAIPAGHAADRRDRQRIVLIAQTAEAAAAALLAALTWTRHVDERGILLLVFFIGAARTYRGPSMQSMLPGLVREDELPRAIASRSSAGQTSMILGPAVGGVLYVAGPAVVYAVTAVLGAAAVAWMVTVSYRRVPPPREPTSLTVLFAGVGFIRARPDVLGVISLDLFAVLLGGATALLPIFAKDILHTGPWGLGILRAAPAVGALLMSLWLTRHTLRRHVGLIMYGAVAGFGAATLVFALSRVMWLSLTALIVLGAFDMVSMVIRGALVQLDTPDAMRGRVSAVNSIFVDTSNQLGEFESGMLAAWIGAVPAAVVGGIGTLAVVGLWMVMFPTLRRRQSLRSASL